MNRPAKQYIQAVRMSNKTGIDTKYTLIFYDVAPYLGGLMIIYFIYDSIKKRFKK